jgi:hypothetical protein
MKNSLNFANTCLTVVDTRGMMGSFRTLASKGCLIAALALQILVAPIASRAMNMPSYDDVSLVYMSTDIVIADLSEDSKKQFTATVIETLYGSLHPGDKLDKLTPFLTFFDPMKDGMRVVLFLDRRPHTYDFLHSDAAKSPFAIPPSGVHLIDQYQHVHSYFQQNNPGSYVATGYWPKEPTQEEDLKLPSLDEERAKIAESIRAIEPVRALLDKTATREDAPALLNLLDRTSESHQSCELRMATAITERATEQIRSLNDPELLLQASVRSGDADSWMATVGFVYSASENDEERKKFAAARGEFLVHALSDRARDLPARLAAIRLLLIISAWNHPAGGVAKVLPIDAVALAGSADELRAVARKIFDDESEDSNLRGLCLEFLLDQRGILNHVRRVYAHTHAATLRFLIEELFLVQGDAVYETLHSPSGAVASIVGPAIFCGCMSSEFSGTVFLAEWRERRDLHAEFATVSSDIERRPVLTNLKTGQRIVMTDYDDLGYSSSSDGSGWWRFRLKNIESIHPGGYSIAIEYISKGKSLSSGYKATVAIRDAPDGKQLTIDRIANGEPPVGWVD